MDVKEPGQRSAVKAASRRSQSCEARALTALCWSGSGLPTWQTGLGLSAGLSTFVCPNGVAGNPLKVGVEGRARFFPSRSISLRSPAFGFTETGSTGRTTDYSALVTFGVPVSWGDGPAR
jgi:hypothetical protein